jgi:hypothetical protein
MTAAAASADAIARGRARAGGVWAGENGIVSVYRMIGNGSVAVATGALVRDGRNS